MAIKTIKHDTYATNAITVRVTAIKLENMKLQATNYSKLLNSSKVIVNSEQKDVNGDPITQIANLLLKLIHGIHELLKRLALVRMKKGCSKTTKPQFHCREKPG